MKNILFIFLLFQVCSCTTNKYVAKHDNQNFGKLRAGKNYTFFHENDLKTKMMISSIEKDSIIGLRNQDRTALSKNTIWKVRKFNAAGTAVLIGGTAGFIAVTAVIASTLQDIGKVFTPPQ